MSPEDIYRELAEVPSFKRATVFRASGVESVSAEYEVRDHDRMRISRFTQDIHLTSQDSVIEGTPCELPSDVVHQSCSPSGASLLILRKGDKRYVEVRDRASSRLRHLIEVTEQHKDFIVNEAFGSPVWNHDETFVAYAADCDLANEKRLGKEGARTAKHRWTPSFGELMTQIRAPAIFVCDLRTSTASGGGEPRRVRQLTPAEHDSKTVFGQPCFVPSPLAAKDDIVIVCTGYSRTVDGRRLGLVYCVNRPSSIYALRTRLDDLPEGQHAEPIRLVADETLAARSPRCFGDQVVFLSNPAGGAHASCSSMHLLRLDVPAADRDQVTVRETRKLVDSVDNPKGLDTFPGLYLGQLVSSPFLSMGEPSVVVDSIWRSWRVPLVINLRSGNTSRIGEPGFSYTILATDGHGLILAARSTTTAMPELVAARTGDKLQQPEEIKWRTIKQTAVGLELLERIADIRSTIISTHDSTDLGPTEVVLTEPPSAAPDRALILEPHGGPHSTLTNEYSAFTLAMALLGFSTGFVNYPGSLGFGQKWIDHLRAHLGRADVDSTYEALAHLRRSGHLQEKASRCFVRGGSHGGYIAAHLTARYPRTFGAAVLRNPVTDLVGTASGGSDIPDWSFAEANLPYPVVGATPPPASVNPQQYETLRNASPIGHVTAVKTPSLLLLGTDDRRVSHQQGLAWAHALRGQGVEAEVFLFEGESHPLSGVETSLTCFSATHAFLKRQMQAP